MTNKNKFLLRLKVSGKKQKRPNLSTIMKLFVNNDDGKLFFINDKKKLNRYNYEFNCCDISKVFDEDSYVLKEALYFMVPVPKDEMVYFAILDKDANPDLYLTKTKYNPELFNDFMHDIVKNIDETCEYNEKE